MLEQLEDRRLLAVWTGTAGDNLWTTPGNWDTGIVPVGSESAIFAGATGGTITVTGTQSFGALQFTNTAGGFTITGGTLSPTSISQSGSVDNIIRSNIAGSAALTLTGGRMLTLSGANSFTGGTNVTDGRLRLEHATALGTGTVTIGAGSYVMLWWNSGLSEMTNNFVLNGIGQNKAGEQKTAIYADGGGATFATYTLSGTITLNATSDISGNNSNNLNITGRITGAGGLTKGGVRGDENNTVTLSNPANDYSGNTTVVTGRLRLGAANVIPDGPGKGGVIVNAGRTLDLGPFNETVNSLSGSGNVIRTGGVMGFTSFTTNAGSDISTSKTYTHKLDFIADNAPATVNGVVFDAATSGAGANYSLAGMPNNIPEGSGAASAPSFPDGADGTGMNQLFRDFYYNGNPGTLTLTGLTAGVTYEARFYNRRWSPSDRTQNFVFDEDGAGPASTPLRFDQDGSATPNYLTYRFTAVSDGAGGALPLTVSFTPNNPDVPDSYHFYGFTNEVVTPAAPTLTVGDGTNFTFEGNISGIGNIAKQGTGAWSLTGTNTYIGSTVVNAGTLNAATYTTVAIPGGDFEVPFNATPPNGNYSYNTAGSPWTFVPASGTAGSGIAGNGSAFGNGTAPGGVQVGLIQRQGTITQTVNVATAGTYKITLATKTRDGQAANPFNVLVDGVVVATITPPSNSVYTTLTTPNFELSAGNHTIQFAGTRADADVTAFIDNVNFLFQAGGNSNAIPDTSPVTVAGGATFRALSSETVGPISGPAGSSIVVPGSTLTVNSTTNSNFGGTISGAGNLTKANTGTLTLSGVASTYTGVTTINGGVLSVNTLANGGAASSIGQSTNAAANLVLNGGTLQYTGAGASTDRLFTLGAAGGTIDSSGPNNGVLAFTNTGAVAFVGAGARTLTLTGTNVGTNSAAGEPLTFNALNLSLGNDAGGATSLVKSGTGLWILGGNSTYSGSTSINQGALGSSTNTGLGSSNVNVAAGAQLQFYAQGLTVANNITLNGLTNGLPVNGVATNGALVGSSRAGSGTNTLTGVLTLAATSNITTAWNDKTLNIQGRITGPGALRMELFAAGNGAPIVTLSNVSATPNDFTGGVILNAGTLNFTADNQLGPSSNAVTFNGGTLSNTNTTGTLNFTHPLIVNAGGGTLNVAGAGVNGKMFLQGGGNQITGSGTLTKNGGGVLQINQPQSFTGPVVLNGLVEAQNPTALGTGTITINNAELVVTGLTFANNLTLNNGATLSNNSGNATTFSGPINAAGNFFVRPRNFQDTGSAGRTINLTGIISGAGGLTVDSTGATSSGTVVLTNTGNSYSGDTFAQGNSILRLGASNVLPDGGGKGFVVVQRGATFDLNGQNESINGLFGGGTVTDGVAATTSTLTVGVDGSSSSFYGAIQNGAGTVALTKVGAGVLALSGANTYSGTTNVQAGTLRSGQTTPVAGALYQLDATTNTIYTDTAGTIPATNGQAVAYWRDAANVNNFTQASATQQPTYQASAINGKPAVRFDGASGSGNDKLVLGTSTAAQSVFIVNQPIGTLNNLDGIWGINNADTGIRASGATTWSTPGNINDFTNPGNSAMYINGNLTNNFGTANSPHILEAIRGSSLTLPATSIGDYYSDGSRSYSGDIGEVLVYGSALTTAQRLTNEAYLYSKWFLTGATFVSDASAVVVANGATFDVNGQNEVVASIATDAPSSLAAAITLGTGGALTSGASGASTTFAGVVSGAGSMTKVGSGTLALTSANTYTGVTTISGGTLSVVLMANGGVASGIGQSTSAASNLIINGGTLQYTGSGATTDRLFNVGLSGATIDASGTVALQFTNTGPLGLNGQVGNRLLTLTGSSTTANSLAASIGEAGGQTSVAKTGVGQWVLAGSNTYTGLTSVNSGVLALSGGSAIVDSGNVTIANAAGTQLVLNSSETIASLAGGGAAGGNVALGANTLTIAGSISTTYAGVISGSGGLTKQGTGTLLLNGTNTYLGPTFVSDGTLGGSGSLVSGPTLSSPATLAPGSNVGTFAVGPLTLVSGSNANFELDTPVTNQDLLVVTGSAVLGGATLQLTYTGGSQPSGAAFVLIRNDGSDAVSGTFNGLPEEAELTVGGQLYRITYVYNADGGAVGNDVAIVRNNGVIAADDTYTKILMNSSFSANVLDNDTDIDGDASVTSYTDPAHGTVVMEADGSFTYTPDADFVGTDTFTYTLSDDENSDTATVSLTVTRFVTQGNTLYVAGSDSQGDRIVIQSGTGGIGVRLNNVLTSGFSAGRVVVYGNGGDDTISVASNFPVPVEFYGDEGNDYLAGGAGNDVLDGGEGNDRLLGGNGSDRLYGGGGNDTAAGGAGNDFIYGDDYLDRDGVQLTSDSPGKDTLNGDAGNDNIYGGAGNDIVNGGTGNDFLYGGDDNDTVDGGDGNDLLLGGGGGDKLYGRAGLDFLIGGAGIDNLWGGNAADLMFAGDLEEDDTTDDVVRQVFALWTANQKAAAMNLFTGPTGVARDDDGFTDTLHGEADADWYALFAFDVVNATEKFGPNVKYSL